jgi:hypothetical protein
MWAMMEKFLMWFKAIKKGRFHGALPCSEDLVF